MADNGQNGASRLDRLEKLMDLLITDHLAFTDEHKRLLTAQVVLTDRLDKLTDRVDKLALSVQDLTEAQKHTDGRLNALITIVDQLVRDHRRPSA